MTAWEKSDERTFKNLGDRTFRHALHGRLRVGREAEKRTAEERDLFLLKKNDIFHVEEDGAHLESFRKVSEW